MKHLINCSTSRVPTNLESQGIWVVRVSQGKVREFWMESGKKKKRRKTRKQEIKERKIKKEREIRYIIKKLKKKI